MKCTRIKADCRQWKIIITLMYYKHYVVKYKKVTTDSTWLSSCLIRGRGAHLASITPLKEEKRDIFCWEIANISSLIFCIFLRGNMPRTRYKKKKCWKLKWIILLFPMNPSVISSKKHSACMLACCYRGQMSCAPHCTTDHSTVWSSLRWITSIAKLFLVQNGILLGVQCVLYTIQNVQ